MNEVFENTSRTDSSSSQGAGTAGLVGIGADFRVFDWRSVGFYVFRGAFAPETDISAPCDEISLVHRLVPKVERCSDPGQPLRL